MKDENGIEKIITPNNEIINCGNKKIVALDYEIDINNTYIFKMKTTADSDFKDYLLNPSSDYMPEITQGESLSYPLLSETGIRLKDISINYNSGTENYYCIDDGEWKEYTRGFNIHKKCNIKAKTIKSGEITKVDEIKYQDNVFNLAGNALGLLAYNDNFSDSFYSSSFNVWVMIDQSMIGKDYIIRSSTNAGGNGGNGYIYARYYTEDDTQIGNEQAVSLSNSNPVKTMTVPENAAKLMLRGYNSGSWGGAAPRVQIHELYVENTPTIEKTLIHPTISSTGVSGRYATATIIYHPTTVKKLYKIDDNDWMEYDNNPIRLEPENTLYAKGWDFEGQDTITTAVFECQQLTDNAIGPEAYDTGDDKDSTFFAASYTSSYRDKTFYMNIDDSLIGKTIRIKQFVYGNANYWCRMYFFDENGNNLTFSNTNNNTFNSYYSVAGNSDMNWIIPDNTKAIAFQTHSLGSTSYGYTWRLHDISIVNE